MLKVALKRVFGTLILQNVLLLSAHAITCDCPRVDPLKNNTCAPRPALVKLYETVAKSYQESCVVDARAPLHFNDLRTFEYMLHSTSEDRLDGVKSYEEVIDYASCYRDSYREHKKHYRSKNDDPMEHLNADFCHFKNTLAPLIKLASESSHLPFAVEACLFKRESQFDQTVVSHSKAKGYIQFIPDTVNELNEELFYEPEDHSAPVMNKNKKRAKAPKKARVVLSFKKLQAKLIVAQEAFRALQATHAPIAELEKSYATLARLYAKWKARKVWESYWAGTKNAPASIPKNVATCPNSAFAAAMVKQTSELYKLTTYDSDIDGKFDLKKLRFNPLDLHSDELPVLGKMNARDTAVMMAGAYNMNWSNFQKECAKSKTLANCISSFSKKNKETPQQMRVVLECASANNWDPPPGLRKRDCTQSSCFKKN